MRGLKSKLPRLLGLVLFAWILHRIDLGAVARIALHARLADLLWIVLLFYPILLLKARRWQTLLRAHDTRLPLGDLFSAYVASYYAGSVTPGRLGEFSRLFYLKNRGLTSGTAAFSVFADRLADVLFLAFLGAAGALRFGLLLRVERTGLLLPGLAAAVLLGLALTRPARTAALFGRLLPKKLTRALGGASVDFRAALRGLRGPVLAAVSGWTLLAWTLCLSQVLLLGRALGIPVSPACLIGAYALSALIGMLPVTIAGIGTRDALLIALFALVGVGRETAVVFSLALLLLTLVQSLQSLPFWLRRPLAPSAVAGAGAE